MKSLILFSLFIVSSTTFAASSPILEDVVVKNKQFSKTIFEALKTKSIKGLITCSPSTCKLIKGGWNYLGSENYGSGDQEKLTKALYDSLQIKETTEEGMNFKTIELNVPDPRGGTERNQLTCIRPGKEARSYGLRDTCQLLNAL
jgi:hypothetical protein